MNAFKKRLVLLMWTLFTIVLPSATFAYDFQQRAINGYDGTSLSASDYDSASVLAIREKQNGATGNHVLFAEFAKFLAAERELPIKDVLDSM